MADDFRVRFGFFDHPKTVKLHKRLGPEAVICFMRLWEFCGRTAGRESGDLRGLDIEDIEIASRWGGESGRFGAMLVEVRYLDQVDGGFILHDFAEHNPHVAGKPDTSSDGRRGNHLRWHVGRGIVVETCEHCRGDIGASRGDVGGASGGESSSPPSPPSPSKREERGTPEKLTRHDEVISLALQHLELKRPGNAHEIRIARCLPLLRGTVEAAIDSTRKADVPNWEYLVQCLESPRSRAAPGKPRVSERDRKKAIAEEAMKRWQSAGDDADYEEIHRQVEQERA